MSELIGMSQKELDDYLSNEAYHNIDILYGVAGSCIDKERWSVLIRAYESFIDGVVNNR
ncbi:hypothetical protein [Vreelandella sp. H-I2]